MYAIRNMQKNTKYSVKNRIQPLYLDKNIVFLFVVLTKDYLVLYFI